MKSKFLVRIDGNDSKVLSVSLQDILKVLDDGHQLHWSILWIYAIGHLENNKNMLDFENEVNTSNKGMFLTWEELNKLSDDFEQLLEIILIGVNDVKDLKRYESNESMYSICKYTIELIDSSYWEIHSLNITALQKMQDRLPGVKFIKE